MSAAIEFPSEGLRERGRMEIKLTQGQVAIIDDEDYRLISQRSWHAMRSSHKRTWYAAANNWKNELTLMHRVILNAPDGLQVDHRNHDGLDNRRANLRLCTNAQNQANRKAQSASGFKGVIRTPSTGKYRAHICPAGKFIHLGTFPTAEEAARAYDEKAKELYGEFAALNFA